MRLLLLMLLFAACTKTYHTSVRNIQFILYTDSDFSKDRHTVIFRPFIKDSGGKVLWDSAFSAMELSNIPDKAHKIVVVKQIRSHENSILKVGFAYQIENVGSSQYIDSWKPEETNKVLDFNFK